MPVIEIDRERYDELVRTEEKINVIKRFIANQSYVNANDINKILDINE